MDKTTPSKVALGMTGRMDYSTNPNGVRISVDPKTGLDMPVATTVPIVQDTTAIRSKDITTGAKIDEKVAGLQPVPAYGSDVKDNNGNVVGQAKYDPNTGQPLKNPNDTTNTGNAPGTITTPDGSTYNQNAPDGMSYSLPSLSDGSKYIYGADGHPYIQDKTGAVTTDPTAEAEFTKNKEAKATADNYNSVLDTYKTGLDAAHTALIDGIKEQARKMTASMEVLNKRTLGAKTVQGYRTGSAEYTPEIDTGILKAEQEEGLARLGEIDTNMKLAIAQAISAKTDKDYELATKRLDLVSSLQKAKEESIQNIYKNYVDNQKIIADKMKALDAEDRAKKDQALQELSTSVPELTKQYDGLKTQAEKDLWLQIMVKKTGLDSNVLKGSMDKSRLDFENKQSILDKRETPTEKAASVTKARDNDIAGAILDFQDQIKNKNLAGINPQAYEYYKKEIKRLYGNDAVLQYDKAIKDAKLTVDTGISI